MPHQYRPSRAVERLVVWCSANIPNDPSGDLQSFTCQRENFSEARVGVNPTVVRANSSSVCRDSPQGSFWCQGRPHKAKTDSLDFNVTFQDNIPTFRASRTHMAAGRHESGTSLHFIEKEILAFQHELLCLSPSTFTDQVFFFMLQPLITV